MKSGKLITLTLAGISLALTGCRRSVAPSPHETEILQPGELSSSQRSSLPTYYPDQGGALSDAPHNAYDPRLGYFHRPCNAWYPYPYDHYDSRWGLLPVREMVSRQRPANGSCGDLRIERP